MHALIVWCNHGQPNGQEAFERKSGAAPCSTGYLVVANIRKIVGEVQARVKS
jgi:hypothetical protein